MACSINKKAVSDRIGYCFFQNSQNFFFALAKNQFQSRQRKRWRSAEPLDETTPDARAVEPDVLRRLDYLSLLQQIHTLPELTREVMYLRLFGKLNLVNDRWYSADARPIIDFSVSVE